MKRNNLMHATLLALLTLLISACGGDGAVPQPVTETVLPELSVTGGSFKEGEAGGGGVAPLFSFSLNVPAAAELRVDYATQDGTARAGRDYTETHGTLVIPRGATTAGLRVALLGDDAVEGDENFSLRLSNPQGVNLQQLSALAIISDDDGGVDPGPETPVQIVLDDATAAESAGDMVFIARLSRAAASVVTASYATESGSATEGSDFTRVSGAQLKFDPGITEQTLRIALINDFAQESTETFMLRMSSPAGAVLASGSDLASGTISDDDAPPPPQSASLDSEVLQDLPTFDRCDFLDRNYCLFPWPNDFFTVADASQASGRRVNLNIASMPKNSNGKPIDPAEWNRNDGFSPGQALLVRIPGLDVVKSALPPITDVGASLKPASPLVVVDADTLEHHLLWSEIDADISKFRSCDSLRVNDTSLALAEDSGAPGAGEMRAANAQAYADCQADPPPDDPSINNGPALIIRPAKNFREGHRYIVALRRMKDSSGAVIPVPAAFRIYRDNFASQLPQVNGRRAHMESLFSTLGAAGVARGDLYLAWDFTVASTRNLSERVLKMRNDALAAIGDSTPGDGIVQGNAPVITNVTISDSIGDSKVAREVRGVISVPSFMDKPNGPTGSRMHYAPSAAGQYGDGLPDRNPSTANQTFDFICRIPRAGFNGAADPAAATAVTPLRTTLYGHGLLGSKGEGGGPNAFMDAYPIMHCATDWIGMASHDDANIPNSPESRPDTVYFDPPGGDIGNVASILQDMSLFPSLADRVQQGLINFTWLGRAILHPQGFCAQAAFKVGTTCVIDRSELFYDGNSQGGIIGGALVAMSPDITRGVLGVVGMNYSTLLQRSVDFDLYAPLLYSAYRSSLDQQFVLSLIQMLWDRAENNGYAQHLAVDDPLPGTPSKRILLHPAFGDHQVTMWSAEVMARTIGASVHCPAVVAGSDVQRGPAVQPGAHPRVAHEAMLFNASANPFGLQNPGRRHPDDEPYFALPCLSGAYSHSGNALVVWDSGPIQTATCAAADNGNDSDADGTGAPAINNTPPRPSLCYGNDPHEHPRRGPNGLRQKNEFLSVGGTINNTCGDKPCVSPRTGTFDP